MKNKDPKSFVNNLLKFFLVDFLETVVITLAIAIVIYIFIASPHVVVGESMMPNFLNHEYLLTNKLIYTYSEPQRGQVIIFNYSPTEEYIKRIVGLPGDTIEVRNGSVYVNGDLLHEGAYIKNSVKTFGMAFLPNNVTITVPKGEYFVMGDNRENSSDSREWGFVKRSAIKGEAWFVYWPLNRFGFVPTVHYYIKNNQIYSKLN